ncbi:Rhodanese-like protein [Dacryopinax primogenitus]|uniref:Rhodanese-like protein n=1 Tax=Dacryopinax primogenitus (strain DJM 731) TaxID=1858805 RepID=M5FSN0_DACPD|nr:Rhodanese-like protein [Dacryopinax primogenitus]EJT98933.1 Rhodanese-like protein [Dacryopinax primogenitus]
MTPATHWVHPSVSYEQVRALADQPSDNVLLIDVREPEEVAQGSIPSSLSLPLSQLQRALHLTPGEFQHTFNFSKPEPEQQVVFYCRSGKRSLSACDLAKREGWDVRNYDGSWLDWVAREQERGRGA